jgi:protein-tyrosine phosphatase
MLAHVERYMKMQRPETWERLYDCGLLMQVNATFFTGFFTRGKALRMLGDQRIHFIGSDCHNVTVRPPYLGTAYGIIRKKYGDGFIDQMDQYGRTMIAPPTEESEQTPHTRIHPL